MNIIYAVFGIWMALAILFLCGYIYLTTYRGWHFENNLPGQNNDLKKSTASAEVTISVEKR